MSIADCAYTTRTQTQGVQNRAMHTVRKQAAAMRMNVPQSHAVVWSSHRLCMVVIDERADEVGGAAGDLAERDARRRHASLRRRARRRGVLHLLVPHDALLDLLAVLIPRRFVIVLGA
jgi:hypothetical protein